MKSSLDDEAIVTGHEPGKGKHVGRMGALHCRLKNGKTFKAATTPSFGALLPHPPVCPRVEVMEPHQLPTLDPSVPPHPSPSATPTLHPCKVLN